MAIQSPYSATDSLTGYLFQIKYSLLEAVRKLKEDIDFSVSIETLDDIVFESSGDAADLLQVKHRSKPGNLTDASGDWWKTIRIWAEQYKDGKLTEETGFYLVTTSNAGNNSAAYYLRPSLQERDVEKAIAILDAVAISSTNQDNFPAYEIYRSLSLEQKTSLFKRVNIIDAAPTINRIDDELRKELSLVVEKKFIQPFLERLESWWYRKALVHLVKSNRQPIYGQEISDEVDQLREQFKRDNLPIDNEIFRAAIDDAIYQDRIFVQQLHLIDLSTKRIFLAVRDYYRAYEQRSRWTRESLLDIGEIDRYERQLIEDWEIHFEQMRDLLGAEAADAEKKKLAQELYTWVEIGSLKQIRSQVNASSLARGSYHMLSDRCEVGWHPEFKQRLMQLLEA